MKNNKPIIDLFELALIYDMKKINIDLSIIYRIINNSTYGAFIEPEK